MWWENIGFPKMCSLLKETFLLCEHIFLNGFLFSLFQINATDAGSSNSSSRKSSPILTHFSPRKSKDRSTSNCGSAVATKKPTETMTAVSMNRADVSLKSVSGETIRSCLATQNDTSHFDGKSVIMPLRNMANLTGTTGHRGIGASGTATTAATSGCDQTSATNRQPIGVNSHSYSSDSDIVPATSATSSATAMRRLYFKSAKLNKTTSITTVHQQQAQHVPKVSVQNIAIALIKQPIQASSFLMHQIKWCCAMCFIWSFQLTKGYGDGVIDSVDCRNNNQYVNWIGIHIGNECYWNGHIDMWFTRPGYVYHIRV